LSIAQADGLVINEFVAINDESLLDASGNSPDWIEIYNGASSNINLQGWFLTDASWNLTKWAFPSNDLLPNGYLIVFADNSSVSQINGELHANFKLDGDGEYLALVRTNAAGATIVHEFAPGYPEQHTDVSYGFGPASDYRYFATPTPGAINAGGASDFVADTKFSHDRGFYSNAFSVTISSATEGAEIHYTLNGDDPTTNSTLYTGPVHITGTTTLRAKAFKTGLYPTDIDTQTYLFVDDIMHQSPNGEAPGPDWPDYNVNGQQIVYGMDPDVYGDPRYTNLMGDALLAIPSISVVTDLYNLFDPSKGIYVRAGNDGINWERPCSLELLNPDGSKGFQVNAGIRIRGGYSRSNGNPKHAFRLFFRQEYGAGKLNYPLFEDEGVDAFDKIDLRTAQNYSWSFAYGTANTLVRDIFSRDLMGACGQPYTRGRYYHLYLNGHYWGIYQTEERPEAAYAASYMGGDREDYDVVKPPSRGGRTVYATDGNLDAYRDLYDMTMAGFDSNERYYRAQGLNLDGTVNPAYTNLLDVENLADYMLVTYYSGDKDGPGSRFTTINNFFCIFNRENPDGFKSMEHDSEHSLNTGVNNMVTPLTTEGSQWRYFNPHWLHERLALSNEEYRVAFGDRTYKHFFNDGCMTLASTTNMFRHRAAQIDMAIIAESARWGDDSDKTESRTPRTKDNHWVPAVNAAVNWMNGRIATVISQLRSQGWYPSIDPPALSRHGGTFGAAFDLTMSAPHEIYYTADGSDPREAITGNAVGIEYTSAVPIEHTVHLKARAKNGDEWSALSEVFFFATNPSPLRVTEVMYNPREPRGNETNAAAGNDAFEFIELQNTGSHTIGLARTRLTGGIEFDFTESAVSVLAPGECVVVVKNRAAFTNRYAGRLPMKIAGEFEGNLGNGGDEVTVVDGLDTRISLLAFDDRRGWPPAADGAGHSLVPLVLDDQLNGALDYGGHWRASAHIDGSPGEADPAPVTDVVINEIMAHTDYDDPGHPEYDSNDWLELFNTTAAGITLADWYLSDDEDELKKWQIPASNVVATLGWIVFDEVTGFHNPVATGFGLNKDGEEVYLSYLPGTAEDRVADCVRFKGQERDRSLGHHGDGNGYWFALFPTPGAANATPTQEVVIGEIMYHPKPTADDPEDNTNDEYIEIHNVAAGRVDLWNGAGTWRIDGGIEYTFPSNSFLASGERLVVVSFNPTNSARMGRFLNAYGLTNGEVRVLGPYSGKLSNRGERVALERPQAPDVAGGDTSWVIVDEVIYFDQAPWPASADGTGRPLQRTADQGAGNDPRNWEAGFWASPGLEGATFRLSSPEYGDTVLLGATFDVSAAIDPAAVSGTVRHVEFFMDGGSICLDTNEPYGCTMPPVAEERGYSLTATMVDDVGAHPSREVIVYGSSVNNGAVSNITADSAVLSGYLSNDGSAEGTIFWGETHQGTNRTAWAHEISLGRRTGGFSAPIAGLLANKVYFFRCYATNRYGADWAAAADRFTTAQPTVTLSIAGSPFLENGGTATVTAQLDILSASNVTAHLAFTGEAVLGADFAASGTTIVIRAGDPSAGISLSGMDDAELETPESFLVTIDSAANAATGTPGSVAGSVISDDPLIANSSPTDITDSTATLRGTLSYGHLADVVVYWGTGDGATDKAAWSNATSLGALPEGPFSRGVTELHANQTYYYRSYATNAGGHAWADSTTNFTTRPPAVSVADITVTEGDSGTRAAVFSVRLSAPSAVDVSVDYATADGFALAGVDYTATTGTLTIAAGQPEGEVVVTVRGDAESEWPSEDFFLDISDPANCTIADSRGVGTIADDDVDVYLVDWVYRMKITFGGYDKGERLSRFPALVVLDTNLPDFSYDLFESPTGGDLRFANSNLTSLLNYEIERWDTNGESLVWVQVPELAGTNSHIWVYWGNPADTNHLPCVTNGATWPYPYESVWHMTEPNVINSAGDSDGTANGNVTSEGLVGDGQFFNNNYIRIADKNDVLPHDEVTVSCWMRTSGGWRDQWQGLVGKDGRGNYNRDWTLRRRRYANYGTFRVTATSATDDPNGRTDLGDDEWHYVVGVYGGGRRYLYVDGVEDLEVNDSGAIATSQQRVYIGGDSGGGRRHRGWIDEVRIAHEARSSNWVWAAWMNMASNSAFNTMGRVESVDPDMPFQFMVYGATNVTDSSAYLTARLTSTGTAETVVSAHWGPTNGGRVAADWANSVSFGAVSEAPPVDFSTNVTGLAPNTPYFYAYRAANAHGTNWVSAEFSTAGTPAVANTGGATNTGPGLATLHGSLTNASDAVVTVYWGHEDGGTNATSWAESVAVGSVAGKHAFSTELSGLLYGLGYYYRCYATNAYGHDWSESSTLFTGGAPRPPYLPGLLAGTLPSAWDPATPNPGTTNFLGPHAGATQSFPPWGDNTTWVYTGEVYLNGGTYHWAENIDDNTLLKIDGTTYINDAVWNVPARSGPITKSAGWYEIEVRFGNGRGGAGPVVNNGWTRTKGFGYNIDGNNSNQGGDYTYPEDDGNMTMFRHSNTNLGAGTLELGIENGPATNVTLGSALLTATLAASGSVYDVWVYWGDEDRGTNTTWDHSAFVGSFTNRTAAISHPLAGLSSDATYYYSFRATNVMADSWGDPSRSFTTPIDTNQWSRRMEVTFAGYDRGATLSDFPVLVVFNTDIAGFSYDQFASSSGDDLRFTEPDGTLLNHEIEKWDVDGDSLVWVRVPGLEGTGADSILAHWGNAVAGAPPPATNGAVWASGFEAVWHFSESNGTSTADSSGNRYHGTRLGDAAFTSGGMPGNGMRFGGASGYVDAPDGFADFRGGMTVSAWVKTDDYTGNWTRIIDFGNGPGVQNIFFARETTSDDWRFDIRNGIAPGSSALTAYNVVELGQWQYVSATIADDGVHTAAFYVDGESVASGTVTLPPLVTRVNNYIGRSNWGNDSFFKGAMDELRLSSRARSVDWVWAEWLNMASNASFCSFGPVEQRASTSLANLAATDVTATSATLQGVLTTTGGVYDAYVHWGQTDGGTATGLWAETAFIGTCTNGGSTNLRHTVTGLVSGMTYHYTFRAQGSETNLWGTPESSFETMGLPVVSNSLPTDITANSATLGGVLTKGSGAQAIVYWGLTDGVTNSGAWAHATSIGAVSAGPFGTNIALLAGGAYHYRCYVTNAYGHDWADSTARFSTPPAAVSVADAVVREGDSGVTQAHFAVTLSAPSASNVTVRFATSNGTAEAGADYAATNGILAIPAEASGGQIEVTVFGDTVDEWPSETFHLALHNPSNATMADDRAAGTIEDDDIDAHLAEWPFRTKITFSGYEGSDVLTNFPALVRLGAHINGFSYGGFASPTGADMRFSDAGLTALLNYEVERWSPAGTSLVWVQVPEISGTNTHIWAYWGNEAAGAVPPSYTLNGAAWSQDYAGVWHLAETNAAGPYDDSSPLANAATIGGTPDNAAGVVGAGKYFHNSVEYMRTIQSVPIVGNAPRTVCAWIRPESGEQHGHFLSLGANSQPYGVLSPFTTGTRLGVWWGQGDAWLSSHYMVAEAWQHITVSHDGDTARVYVNGRRTDAVGVSLDTVLAQAELGSSGWQNHAGTHRFTSDEFRVSTVARRPDWIHAVWLNQLSNGVFNSHGPVLSDVPAILNLPASDLTATSASFNGVLVSTGASPASVSLYWGTSDGGADRSAWAHTNDFGPQTGPTPLALSTNISGLTDQTTYYYRFSATNASGASMGTPSQSFTTPSRLPAIVNDAPTLEDGTSMTLNATLTATGNAPATVYVSWGREDGGSSTGLWQHTVLVGACTSAPPAAFHARFSGLTPRTTYFYRFHAANAFGRAWAPATHSATTPDYVNMTLIAAGSRWRYEDSGTEPGTAWRDPSFDDGAWPVGPAQLGFGDGDEATTNASGHVTTYYRHTLELTAADVTALAAAETRLALLRDDGAVVYINGTEVERSNMPTGTIDHLATATSRVDGAEEDVFIEYTVDSGLFVAGTNVIAVELHQETTNSVDASFDLALTGQLGYPVVAFHPLPTVGGFSLSATHTNLSSPWPTDHSGCALEPATDEIVVVLNRAGPYPGAPAIHVYDRDGVFQRRVELPGFDDAEGISQYDPSRDEYAISEEGVADITVVTITTNTTSAAKSSGRIYSTGMSLGNRGLEGVSRDRARNRLYSVKESAPMAVYRFPDTPGPVTVEPLFDAEQVFEGHATDLSDVFYDARSDRLLILSHEARTVFECDLKGNIIDSLPLDAVQAEGVALSADGTEMHIVSEANHYYRYSRPGPDTTGGEGVTAEFDVRLTSPWTNAVSVDYVVSSDTAVFGSDYTNGFAAVTGTVHFAAGTTTGVVSLAIIEDGELERDETLRIVLRNPTHALLGGYTQHLHTIAGTTGVLLTVSSEHGTAVPPEGLHGLLEGSTTSCSVVDSPRTSGATQYVCVGWAGSGDVPASGTGTNTGAFAVNRDSAIAWLWATNYWLAVRTEGPGSVSNGNAWYTSGTNADLVATGAPYYGFAGWSGDTAGGDTNQARLIVTMDRGRTLTAAFSALLAAHGTPQWWLARYYGHTNDFDRAALSDTDRDGLAAWKEYWSGTSPTDPTEGLWVHAMNSGAGGSRWVIHWNSVTGRLYSVYSTPDLTSPSWTTNLYRAPGNGSLMSYTNNHADVQLFFRLGVEAGD